MVLIFLYCDTDLPVCPDWELLFSSLRLQITGTSLEVRSIHTLANRILGLAVHGLYVSRVWDWMWHDVGVHISQEPWVSSAFPVCVHPAGPFFMRWASLRRLHSCFLLNILHFNKFLKQIGPSGVCVLACLSLEWIGSSLRQCGSLKFPCARTLRTVAMSCYLLFSCCSSSHSSRTWPSSSAYLLCRVPLSVDCLALFAVSLSSLLPRRIPWRGELCSSCVWGMTGRPVWYWWSQTLAVSHLPSLYGMDVMLSLEHPLGSLVLY